MLNVGQTAVQFWNNGSKILLFSVFTCSLHDLGNIILCTICLDTFYIVKKRTNARTPLDLKLVSEHKKTGKCELNFTEKHNNAFYTLTQLYKTTI